MININTLLLERISIDQLGLLCHLMKRADSNLACYPSNKTLCEDTGWKIKKLQKVKSELMAKGILVVNPRIGNERQGSNWYRINSDLIGIYVPGKNLSILMQDQATPKRDNHDVAEKGIGAHTPKRDNISINHNEVLSTESKDSVTQIPFTSEKEYLNKKDSISKQDKKADEEFPEYTHFVRVWSEKYKLLMKFPRDGRMFKELIQETRRQIDGRGVPVTKENTIEFWEIFVGALHKTWAHNRILPTINQHYPSLIAELENGNKGRTLQFKPSTRDIINAIVNS